MKFKLLIIKRGNILHYRVVYQSETKRIIDTIGIRTTIYCADCPEITTHNLFLRGSMPSYNHNVKYIYEERLSENFIEKINTYYAELQNISN